MADDFKKSGLSFQGVNKAEFQAAQNLREQDDMAASMAKRYKEINDNRKKTGDLESFLKGELAEQKQILADIEEYHKGNLDLSQKTLDNQRKQREAGSETGDAITNMFPAVSRVNTAYMDMKQNLNKIGISLGAAGMLASLAIAVKLALDFAKAITDTRKELGTSVVTSMKVVAANKVLAQVAKRYGLDLEDITSAQAAIRNDLGASVQESVKLSLSFARTAAATGQSSEDLAKTLSIMESISGASREVLLNQLRSNAAMIEAAGVAPALVMKDIAANAEFFASFAKDGGQNLIGAGVAARNLGLDMSAIASTTEALLDFETSIEKQMEASMLLGRQINLDRARQLALSGDQEGMMQEILKQVGGEAEFNRMNVLQRRALAESVGQSVENLSRLVRNNTATTTAGTVAKTSGDSVYNAVAQSNNYLEEIAITSKKQLNHLDSK